MGSNNIQLARDAITAWNRREPDIWTRYATPDFEWLPAGPAAVETDVYHGHAEAAVGVTTAFETFELFEFEGDDVRDLGDGALWLGHLRTRGGASGVEFEREFALQFTIAGERFTRVRGHASWADALKAAGHAD
jgi:ketosteroid isomerase-like protein